MKTGFIFPGQGSQYKCIGKNLYNRYDYAKKLFNEANDILEYDLKKICFSNDNNDINKTIYTQPAIFIYSIICDFILKDKNFDAYSYAGHSLGEYSALVSSKCITFTEALKIIKVRSKAMYLTGKKNKGKMLAVLSSDYSKLEKIIKNIKSSIVIANYNSKKQTILSGYDDEIKLLNKYLKNENIKSILLNVSGAFHSPIMNDVKTSLDNIIDKTQFNNINKPIYQNSDPIKNLDSKKIKNNLKKQITSSVRWIDIINNMHFDGTTNFIEVGPGNVLTKLNKNINSDIICTNFNKL